MVVRIEGRGLLTGIPTNRQMLACRRHRPFMRIRLGEIFRLDMARLPAWVSNIGEKSDMDKDRVAGSVKQAKGALKEAAGKVIGDTKLAAEGKSEKAEGKIQNTLGGVKDTLKEASNS
jgi:uncharacterized protein YjbJ (UPF0337 family)